MQFKNRLFLLGAAGVVLGSLAQACATDVNGDDLVEDAGTVDSGEKKDAAVDAGRDTGPDAVADVTVPETSTDTGSDTGTGAIDAGRDSGPDAGPNLPGETFDPTAPKEGDACPAGVVENGTIERRCGYCGTQKAFCTNSKVGAYGPCAAEHVDANRCLPNAARGSSCGICGTQVETCDPDACTWSAGACENEVANGCTAGDVSYITGACVNPDEVRKQTCSASCQLGAPEACAPEPIDTIIIPIDGSTATGIFKFEAVRTAKWANEVGSNEDSFICPTPDLHAATPFHTVLLKNPTNAAVTVEAWPSTAPGGTDFDTISTGYVGRASRPSTDAEIKACIGVSNDYCNTAPCQGNDEWSGLVGAESLTIPANGSAIVMTSQYSTSTAAGKALQFNVRVYEPPPPFVIAAVAGQSKSYNCPLNTRINSLESDHDDLTCPATVQANNATYGAYVTLTNPTALTAKVEVWSDDSLDTIMASYAGAAPPANRTSCQTVVSDYCANALHDDACLMDANAITIAPNGSATLYVAQYFTFDGSGVLPLTFRTKSLQ